jgi:ribosomal protein S18 acetylase RimI-like enzyme
MQALWEQGYSALDLYVTAGNDAAQALYAKLGFTTIAVQERPDFPAR